MANNSDAPGFVLLQYQRGTFIHKAKLHVNPDGVYTPGDTPTLVQRDTSTIVWTTAVDDFINVIKGIFNTAVDFTLAEYWQKPNPADDPVFIQSHAPGLSGTVATATSVASQAIWTFRTFAGGIKRLYLMESVNTPNQFISAPFAAGTVKTISDYMVAATGWIVGKDNSYPYVPLRYLTKTNDALLDKTQGV